MKNAYQAIVYKNHQVEKDSKDGFANLRATVQVCLSYDSGVFGRRHIKKCGETALNKFFEPGESKAQEIRVETQDREVLIVECIAE